MNPPGVYPIAIDPVTLGVATFIRDTTTEFETNPLTLMLEDLTNVHIEWTTCPEADFKQKLNLMLAGGSYPDIIMRSNFSGAEEQLYYQQGVLYELGQYIDAYCPNTVALFEEYPLVKAKLSREGGTKLYSLPRLLDTFQLLYCQRAWINQQWLKNLNLEMPDTTEEFYQVLKAFKENDANGNGDPNDELPLVASQGARDVSIDGFIMNAFIYTPYDSRDATWRLTLNDGKIDMPYDKEEYREGLRYLHKLYEEGLIAPESFTQNAAAVQALSGNPDGNQVGVGIARFPYQVYANAYEDVKNLEYEDITYVALPPLTGPSGMKVARYTPYYPGEAGFNLTTECEIPEIAMRWADTLYQEDVSLSIYLGDEGTGWEYIDPSEEVLSLSGGKATWRALDSSEATNYTWGQGANFFISTSLEANMAVDENSSMEYFLYKEVQEKYEPYQASLDLIAPPIDIGTDNAARILEIQTSLDEYINTMTVKFIIGQEDIETGWENYVNTLDKMGLSEYLEYYNEAYVSQYGG